MKKKILITGAAGQLGSEMQELAVYHNSLDFLFTDLAELDICDPDAVNDFCGKNSFDYLVNCAAFTAVDKAESETEAAEKLNCRAPSLLARASDHFGFRLIHISTDFVFDGTKSTPYMEDDLTNPLSVYGKTKLDGENEIMKFATEFLIIRTSWLYSVYGSNFVKNMIRYGRERETMNVVFDQVGSPTYARDLAEVVLQIIENGENNFQSGIYHYSNEGVCSWYDFAKVIMNSMQIKCGLQPIRTSGYPTPATRPAYSVMDKSLIKKVFELKIPYWHDSLRECLGKLGDSF